MDGSTEPLADDGRSEHVAWRKERALEYADAGDMGAALVSDLGKHPGTGASAAIASGPLGAAEMLYGTPASMRRFIEGFR